MSKIILVFVIFGVICNRLKASDPCGNYKTLDEWRRSVKKEYDVDDKALCDSTLESGWYRVTSKAGEQMPTECPVGGSKCDTFRPIWLNDTFPTLHQTKNVNVCVADAMKGCCMETFQIQIKSCSGFYVYNLIPTYGCPKAYCFGNEVPCPEGYTSPTNFTPGCQFDPCLTTNYKLLEEEERSIKNNITDSLCDSILSPGWYRPASGAGTSVPLTCPKNGFTCGTYEPIWINGSLPKEGKNATVNGCVSSDRRGCCSPSYDIQVKNCSSFNVYKLNPTSACPQAYCFGSEIRCQKGFSSPTGFTPGCTFDPCHPINYLTITGQEKRTSNYTLRVGDIPINDAKLDRGWYRFDSYTGNDMVVTRQEPNQCGSLYPIWMKGQLPKSSEDVVTRTVCVSGTYGCKSEYQIKSKKCDTFSVYYLLGSNITDSAYCIGNMPIKVDDKTAEIENNPLLTWMIAVICLACVLVTVIVVIIYRFMLRKSMVDAVDSPPSYKKAMEKKPGVIQNDSNVLFSVRELNNK